METPQFLQTDAGFYSPHFAQDNGAPKNGDHFIIDDLLDFPNDDDVEEDGGFEAGILTANSTVDTSCNSSTSFSAETYFNAADLGGHPGFADGQFSSELCHVRCDDLAELEWVSNFVEESFSSEDLQKLQLIQGMKARTNNDNEANSEIHQYHFQPETISRGGSMLKGEMSVPAKARSKRSRAAPGNWTSRLLAVAPTQSASTLSAVSLTSSSSDSNNITTTSSAGKKVVKAAEAALLKEGLDNSLNTGEGRKCLHCATDKTPQWRTGPMGPKTLCNACGVRYKSGRLVPEYRPASSPTFVLTKHSNSHRKVVELRRQKELMIAQQQHQQFLNHQSNMMFDASNGDDYLIHQRIGPDFRQLI